MQKQVIILFGPPGAGKGTQSELLSEKFSLYYFETSRILEETFKNKAGVSFKIGGTEYSVAGEKKLWEEGKLCNPPFVAHLVQEKIKELFKKGESLILAGSPRTIYEAEKVMPLVENLYSKENIKVAVIEISPEQTIFRNSNRKICELMRHPILFNKETENLTVCPLDGSKLERRKGLDDPESIKVRLKEYKERTYPVIEYFEKTGIKVAKVKGEQSVADVYKDILKAIG